MGRRDLVGPRQEQRYIKRVGLKINREWSVWKLDWKLGWELETEV